MDEFNVTNSTIFDNVTDINNDKKFFYSCVIPPMLIFCLVSVLINVRVLLCIRWIRRPLSPTLQLSLSLAAADALASAAFGTGIFMNSFLPYVFGINIYCPVAIINEIYRLSGCIITVLHLLALAANHYLGILKPLHYHSIMTTKRTIILIILLWISPTIFFSSYFLSADKHFWLEGCGGQPTFLDGIRFRLVFSSLFFIPLILMSMCYAHILIIVKKQQRLWSKLSRAGSMRNRGIRNSCQQRRTLEGNVKAIYTTLLILGSCMVGWLPANISYILICHEGCYILNTDVKIIIPDYRVQLCITWLVNILLILKTLINPIIYSTRMYEIEEGTRRMHLAIGHLCCSRDREHMLSDPLRLGYSASSMQGGVTALCRLNGSLSHRSIGRSHVPNTFV